MVAPLMCLARGPLQQKGFPELGRSWTLVPAQVDGASILSQDKDFLRYRNATYTLYKNYGLQNETIETKVVPLTKLEEKVTLDEIVE